MGINKQTIIGNLGKDPEARQGQDGSLVCRFTVAVTESAYTTQNGVQIPEHTEWFNIRCTGKKADVARQYLHKGDKVYIEGKTYTGEYIDQQGIKKTYTEVRCNVLELLTPKQQGQQQGYVQQPTAQQYAPAPAQAPQYSPTPVQQPYVPAQAPAPQVQMPVGVFGQAVQAVPAQQAPAQAAPANGTYWPG